MSDVFQDAARKATRDAEKVARDAADPNAPDKIQARIATRKIAVERAIRLDPPYPWPKRFFDL